MLALANDHAGLSLKAELIALLDEMQLPYRDFGTNSAESCDYASFAYPAAKAVAEGDCDRALLICGTGLGMSLAANKVHGIRAVVCSDTFTAQMSRLHNDANVLSLGARVVGAGLAKEIVKVWLTTEFEGGRHQRRVSQITQIENGNFVCPVNL